MKQLFIYQNSVYKRLLCQFLICTLLPLLILAVISYETSYDREKKNIESVIKTTNEQIAGNVANRIEQVEKVSETVMYHMYRLSTIPMEPLSAYLDVFRESRVGIDNATNVYDILRTVVFLPENKLLSEKGNHIDILPLRSIEKYNCTDSELLNSPSISFWKFTKEQAFAPAVTSKKYNVLTYWNASRNLSDRKLNYAYAINIASDEFDALLSQADLFNGKMLIVDAEENVVSASDNTLVGSTYSLSDDIDSTGFIENKDYICLVWNIHNSFKLITCINKSVIRNAGMRSALNILKYALIMILLATVSNILISKDLTGRINCLSKVIEKTQTTSDRNVLADLDRMSNKEQAKKDEIDNLADTYRTMLLQNDEIKDKYLQAKLQEEKLKYQLFYAEINPHFLFNTLNAIKGCLLRSDYENADNMLSSLGEFYRMILKAGNDMIQVKQEIQIAELYLKMISFSSEAPITWKIDVENGVDNFMICKFVMQPIIENAVFHGSNGRKEGIHIDISVKYAEDGVYFRIADNGVGVTSKTLEDLKISLKDGDTMSRTHYGLINVDRRLMPYLLDNDHLILSSEYGRGMVCEFCIQQIYPN